MSTYKIDAAHSEITFKAKHLMITNVTGSFTQFEATIESEKEDFTDAKISFEANTASVNTNNTQRDEHLKSNDFFATEKYPVLKFVSTEFKKIDGNDYALTGNLTIKNTTQPVTLNVEFLGLAKDPWGQTKAGFEATGKINRTDFGLTWNAALEAGGVLVSEDIKLNFNVQFVKQA
ncbi:MAG: YceI family protein [Bacteroidetes bacterium]|nr:YceI family protein [Bacteroidota bacterium]MBS1649138.1 YceI family protein [Bacteroidota bacterium]